MTYSDAEYELAVSGISLTLAAFRMNEKVCLCYTRAVGLMIIHDLVNKGEYDLQITELESVEEPRGFVTAIVSMWPLLNDPKFLNLLRIVTVYQYEKDGLIKQSSKKPVPEVMTIQ